MRLSIRQGVPALRLVVFGAAILIGIALGLPPVPASAQAVLGQAECRGSYQGVEIRGTVVADLWQFVGPSAGSTLGSFGQLYEFIMRGELEKVPGTVRLFGQMFDPLGNLVNFEVFLQGVGRGTGSVWINNQRHRETYMNLVVVENGLEIYPETGDVARFECVRQQ